MSRTHHTSTPTRPPRVTYTTSPALTHDDARRRVRSAYRLLLGLDPWPTDRGAS